MNAKHIKTYCLLILAFLFTKESTLNADEWEWAPEGAIWYYNTPPLQGDPLSVYEIIESIGDTMISGKNCNIMGKDLYMYQENDSVFYWHSGEFRLIYDFTAMPTDTIQLIFKAMLWTDSSHTEVYDTVLEHRVVIESIDTIERSGEVLRQFNAHILPNPISGEYVYALTEYTYTEKIGSDYQMVDYVIMPTSITSTPVRLRCYEDKHIEHRASWWEAEDKDCNYGTHTNLIPQREIDALSTSIYPNPAKDIIYVNIQSEHRLTEVLLRVYDMQGRKIYERDHINSRPYEIDATHWQAGIYMIHLLIENNLLKVERLVVE